jgi:hypothetical protein
MSRFPRNRPRLSIALPVLLTVFGCTLAVALAGTATVSKPQTVVMSSAHTTSPEAAAAHPRVHRRHHHHKRHHPRVSKGRRVRTVVGPPGPPGAQGPEGPPGPQVALSLAVNWLGLENAPGHDSSSAGLAGIGTLTATCNEATQTLTLTPAGNGGRTVLDVTTFQGEGTEGASSNERLTTESASAPISVPLPPNGMVSGTLSVEPISGNSGALALPASFMLSSEWKTNDPNTALNYCYVAAQLLHQQ